MRHLATFFFLFVLCANANSAVFIVDSLSDPEVDPATYEADCDDGDCTLREAITLAVTDGDEIHFSVTGTIALSASLPEINNRVSIIGPGPETLIIDGGQSVRPFYIGTGANNTLLQGFSIANGYSADEHGGGLKIEFTSAVLRDLVFSNNVSEDYGGAIDSLNTMLDIAGCVFEHNSSKQGGALYFLGEWSMVLDIVDSIFDNNSATGDTLIGNGGAILANAHELKISGSTFTNNTSSYFGGAIYTPAAGARSRKTLIDTTEFKNNSSSRDGGGIFLQTSAELKTSLFTENSADFDGGAIIIRDDEDDEDNNGVLIENCTFSGNSAGTTGGALIVDLINRDTAITHSTIVENSCGSLSVTGGGGGVAVNRGVVQAKNNIIVNNYCTAGQNDCALLNASGTQTVTSYGYNNVEYPSECDFSQGSDNTGVIYLPYYSSLADNGGPTRTHALTREVLGICTGLGDGPPLIEIDQRGMLRDDRECHRGAYEFRGYFPLDLNADNVIDLKDCITALQVCTGSIVEVDARAARGPDNIVGLDEVIAILQSLAAESL